jgi:hypothetical protein
MNCPYLTIPQKFPLKLDASVLAALQDGLAEKAKRKKLESKRKNKKELKTFLNFHCYNSLI